MTKTQIRARLIYIYETVAGYKREIAVAQARRDMRKMSDAQLIAFINKYQDSEGRLRRNPSKSNRPVKIYGNVTRIYLKGGSYALARKPREYGLPNGDLWITWGNGRNIPDPENLQIEWSYGRVLRVEAQKAQRHLCDAKCKEMKHQYYHLFSEPNEMVQLRDGSLLISSR